MTSTEIYADNLITVIINKTYFFNLKLISNLFKTSVLNVWCGFIFHSDSETECVADI